MHDEIRFAGTVRRATGPGGRHQRVGHRHAAAHRRVRPRDRAARARLAGPVRSLLPGEPRTDVSREAGHTGIDPESAMAVTSSGVQVPVSAKVSKSEGFIMVFSTSAAGKRMLTESPFTKQSAAVSLAKLMPAITLPRPINTSFPVVCRGMRLPGLLIRRILVLLSCTTTSSKAVMVTSCDNFLTSSNSTGVLSISTGLGLNKLPSEGNISSLPSTQ